jgi:hypothetical protein
VSMKISSKDPGTGHFAVSLVKSIFRLVASAILLLAGYYLYGAENYTDLLLSDAGYFLMLAGGGLFCAEVLGIVEEIV